jgi:hypothetical protein
MRWIFSTTATEAEASRDRTMESRKGLHPMRFPQDDEIPTTEDALHAQGVKFCFHKILEQNRCLAKAKVSPKELLFFLY